MNTFHNGLSSIPVLVCLTHADILYEDCEDDIVPICPEDKVEKTTLKFNSELQVSICVVLMFILQNSSYCVTTVF